MQPMLLTNGAGSMSCSLCASLCNVKCMRSNAVRVAGMAAHSRKHLNHLCLSGRCDAGQANQKQSGAAKRAAVVDTHLDGSSQKTPMQCR
jgi:hypothetical protein